MLIPVLVRDINMKGNLKGWMIAMKGLMTI